MTQEETTDKEVKQETARNNKGMRDLPISTLDAEMMTTNPVWGREVPEELWQELQEKWGQLGFYTRDLRLGNLKDDQEVEVNYYLNLAGDCLDLKCIESFMICLRRAITMTEVSQSRKMALREMMNTLRYQNIHKDDESGEPAKGLLGRKKS